MVKNLDRRGFAIRSSWAVGSLFAGTWIESRHSIGNELHRSNQRMLLLGLNALARAHEMDYFADGHRGAGIISAHLLGVDNALDESARTRIAELVDRNWGASPLCRPFPDTEPTPGRINEIGATLVEGGKVLRQVGHNAIFAMLAVKAFRMLPSVTTPERIDGVCKMIRSFTPWRDVEPDSDVDPPPFADAVAASRFVLQEASAAIDRFVGFGQGYAGHMLTFGQALIDLAAMGDVEWAESCRTAFRKYVTVTRLGPSEDDKRRPDHKLTHLRPIDAEYWRKRGDNTLGIGHVFKYPYAYYDLQRRADDPALRRDLDGKMYHLF